MLFLTIFIHAKWLSLYVNKRDQLSQAQRPIKPSWLFVENFKTIASLVVKLG